jgi:hypothetical protein
MCRENLQTEMIRNSTDPILKLNETVISIADETIPKTSTFKFLKFGIVILGRRVL